MSDTVVGLITLASSITHTQPHPTVPDTSSGIVYVTSKSYAFTEALANAIYSVRLTLTGTTPQTIDFYNAATLDAFNVALNPVHVLGILIVNNGSGAITIGGQANTLPFLPSSGSLKIGAGGMFLLYDVLGLTIASGSTDSLLVTPTASGTVDVTFVGKRS